VKESEFQSQVIMLARLFGWLVMHTRTVQIRPGVWATPLQGDSGFPDLVLAHEYRGVLFAELKSEDGRVGHEQQDWIDTLLAGGAEVHVWRPKDLEEITARLSGRNR
jgi:hypothetical protein